MFSPWLNLHLGEQIHFLQYNDLICSVKSEVYPHAFEFLLKLCWAELKSEMSLRFVRNPLLFKYCEQDNQEQFLENIWDFFHQF